MCEEIPEERRPRTSPDADVQTGLLPLAIAGWFRVCPNVAAAVVDMEFTKMNQAKHSVALKRSLLITSRIMPRRPSILGHMSAGLIHTNMRRFLFRVIMPDPLMKFSVA